MARESRPYLVEDRGRENEAVRTLVGLPFIAERLFQTLGINPYFCWFLLFAKKQRLLRTVEGDIDLLAGPLQWNDPLEFEAKLGEERKIKVGWHETWPPIFAAMSVARNGGIKWPPTLDHLVAIEAKCAYLNPQAEGISRESMKSTKASKPRVRRIRGKLESLLEMGFDSVGLLDIIANSPVSGVDGGAWFVALDVADRSKRVMLTDLANRLSEDSPVGHYVWSAGAVVGGNESRRGAGAPEQLRPSLPNPLLVQETRRICRHEVQVNLHNELEAIPAPLNLRVILEDCQSCGKIHSDLSLCVAQRELQVTLGDQHASKFNG